MFLINNYKTTSLVWTFLIIVSYNSKSTIAFRRDGVEKRIIPYPFRSGPLPLRNAVEHIPQKLRDSSVEDHFLAKNAALTGNNMAPNLVPLSPTQLYIPNWWNIRASAIRSPDPEAGRNVYCFFESWSAYRKPPAAFSANDIDPHLCTHVIYAFARVNLHTNKLVPVDEEYDIVKGGYRSLIFLKRTNPRLKILLSVAGPLSNMTSTAANRRTFILSTVRMLQEYGFDGLDLHWEFPGAEDLGGRKDDKNHFAQLVEEMSDIFEARGLLLVASVSPSRFRIEDGYDVPRLSQHLKHILLKSFDFHTERSSGAIHHSPLTATADQDPLALYFNVDYSVRYWLKRGVKREQLILGIPFYGRSYTLKQSTNWIPGSPTISSGKESRFTQQPGFMAYYEVCEKINDNSNKWRLFRDTAGAPFMVNDDQWVGYEDPTSIQIKARYIREQKLGGAMVWAIDLDDFYGHCGHRYPLLNTIKAELDPKPYFQILTPAVIPTYETKSMLTTPFISGEVFTLISHEDYENDDYYYVTNKCIQNEEGYYSVTNKIIQYNNLYEDDINDNSSVADIKYVKNNFDCSIYFKCVNSVKYLYICSGKLRYNNFTNMCDLPLLVKCDKKDTSLNPISSPTSVLSGNIVNDDYSFRTSVKKKLPDPDIKQDSLKVVCYFTNWAWYRKAEGKFYPEHIPPHLCTDIVYAFASLDPNDFVIKPFDSWTDIDNNFYARVIARASGDANVLLSVGGWTDSAGSKYSQLVSNASNRSKFIVNVISFLRKHSFDGLHIDWNYPVCWQSNCKKGPASDKPNFTKFIQELRAAFNKEKPPLKLAAAISGYKEIIDRAYDLKILSKELDFISVMTFDYHGAWEKETGHVSPLFGEPSDLYPDYNVDSTMKHLVSTGADKSKLVIGVPFYGQSFTLASADKNMIGDEVIDPGDAGDYTKQPGMLAYYEICHRIKKHNWKTYKSKSGPYATHEDQWVSFDDPTSVREKARYVKSNGYGGIMAWTLDLDDYNNKCCRESFPLLKNINREFGYLKSNEPTSGDCSKPPIPSTPPSVSTMTTPDTGEYIDAESSTAGTPTSTSSTSTTQQTWWSQPVTKPTTEQTWWPTQTSTTTSTSTTTTTTSTTTKKPKPSTTSKPSSTTTTTTTTTTIEPSTTTTEKDIDEDNDVTSCNTGDYKPVKGNCNAYYRCILGEFRKEHCAGSLHWNNEIKICDWPENAKCKEEITDGSSTTTVIPSSSTTTPRPDEWWTQPTMTWWSEAITTSTTTTTKRPTIWWSPDTKPTTKPTTVFTSRPTTTRPKPTTTSTTTENLSTTVQAPAVTLPSTPCSNGQYYPVAGSCTKFAVCFNGALISQQCGPGLYWNQQQGMCDWSYNVDCHENYRLALQWWKLALNNEGVGQQINTRVGGEDSACSRGQFAPHPTNCNKYLQCQWGLYEIYSCPPGLHWNSNRQICDWPANSHCDSKAPAGPGDIQSEEESHTEEAPKLTSSPKPAWTWTTPSTTEWSWTPSTPTPPKPTKPNRPHKKHPLSGHFKVVCYFTNWAWYRQGIGKYFPEDVDTDLCTHIQYGFAVLDYENLVIKPHDSWADIDNRFYERVVELKDRGIKVLLAIGGWNDSEGDKYSRLVNNPGARQRFIQHIVQFLKKYDFDGLDLDWEYPKCWQVNCDRGPESDKANFGLFVKEIKAAFKPHKLLLSAAVSPSKTVIDAGYDVKAIAESLDWVSVMTYDYHGQWDKKTGHVAPMYYHPDDTYDYFNSNFSINYWIQEGVPPRKLVMGMPLYGQSFRLSNVSNNGLNAPASGPGEAGEQTAAAGFLAYYEICDRIKNKGWTVVQDPEHRMGPYAYKNEQWVSFDDQPMIKRKSEYIRKMNLGGGMIWALDLDDFRNRCGGGEYTLLKTIASTLAKPPKGVEMVTEAEITTPETTTAESPANVTQVLTTTEVIDEFIPEDKLNKVPSYFYNEQLRKAILCELQPNFCKGNMGTKK